MLLKIGNKRYVLNENLLQCDLFKHIIENQKSMSEPITLEIINKKFIKLIFDGKMKTYIEKKVKSSVLSFNGSIPLKAGNNGREKRNAEEIVSMYTYLCYLGNDEMLEILYKAVHDRIFKICQKQAKYDYNYCLWNGGTNDHTYHSAIVNDVIKKRKLLSPGTWPDREAEMAIIVIKTMEEVKLFPFDKQRKKHIPKYE